jgi:autotransporter-associated beta strand protein
LQIVRSGKSNQPEFKDVALTFHKHLNPPPNMKNSLTQPKTKALSCLTIVGLLLTSLVTRPVRAATDIWTGGGADGRWQTPANWGGTPPSAGDALTFQGTVRLNNTNNFTVSTVFNGISFNSPAGAFNLFGNPITLANDIVDNQVVVNQSVNLPLSLDATHNLNVINNGLITINGVISGAAGAGITLPGAGRVTLTATNTFTGPVAINNGTLFVSSDANLGAAPAAPTPGRLCLTAGLCARAPAIPTT